MKRFILLVLALCMALTLCASAETSNDLEDMLAKGAQFVAEGDYSSAGICYDVAMKLSPDDPVVLTAVADMYLGMQDYPQALASVEDALALAPSDGALYLVKARILFEMGAIEDAETAIRYAEICGADAGDELRLTAAVAYAEHGDSAKAVEAFDQVDSGLWFDEYSELYGRALVRSGNRDRAEALGLVADGAKDAALAAALQDGQDISLSPMTEDVSGYPFFCSAAFYEENKDEDDGSLVAELTADGLRVKLANSYEELGGSQAELVAVSPSGEIALYRVDAILAICSDGELTGVYPNSARGAQDEEHAALTYRYYDGLGRLLEQDSIAWSPDERYFALTFPKQTMTYARYMDLIVVDSQTGEWFVAEATPKDFKEEGCLSAVSACFDTTGENVYYLVYGDIADGSRCGIKRYNLETGAVELLCAVEDIYVDRPRICMDAEGRLRGITDSIKADEHAGTIEFALNGGEWTYTVRECKNSIDVQMPMRLLYSANSDIEVVQNLSRKANANSAYLTLRTDSTGERDHDTAIMLPKAGSQAEAVEINDDFVQNYIGEADAEVPAADSPWLNVIRAELSPDGYYALILASDGDASGLYLLDLQTLAFARLAMPQGTELLTAEYFSMVDRMAMGWISDSRIVIPTMAGGMMCKIELG